VFAPILLPAHNPGPMTGSGNNTFLIVAGGTATLVDAGQGRDAHLQLLAEQLARSHARLDRVVVTHAHPDHASGAPAIAAAHPEVIFQKSPWQHEDAKYPVNWQRLSDGDRIDIGDDGVVALHTPGHSPDHLSFWHEPSRTLFTGDLVIAGGSVMIHASGGGNLAQYLASLERIRDLKPARLLPAHGDPIDQPDPVLAAYIEHRLARERQVLDALAGGLATVQALAESIYDGLNPALLPAAHETVRAHLEKLRREGRAQVVGDRWSID
jgi:glyoxylase-like metal-dependent hydrolase (beta-lactamase superfamily II)